MDETFGALLLALLILWTLFLTGMLIWNNPFTYQQVAEAEEDEDGPWPDSTKTFCRGCGSEIDPETCGCGDPIYTGKEEDRNQWIHTNHPMIPMGCDCWRSDRE